MTDYAHTVFAEQARERKAVALEYILREAGATSGDLTNDTVRADALKVLSAQRGKRVTASIDTWRFVWRLMHEQETRPNPFADQPREAAACPR